MKMSINNPRRQPRRTVGTQTWFPYYASFSQSFAESLLGEFTSSAQKDLVIADPWNGSGTTTEAASTLGYQSYGFDLNPVMSVIAKARLLDRRNLSSIGPLLREIQKRAKTISINVAKSDLLEYWYSEQSILSIRSIDSAIQQILIDSDEIKPLCMRDIDSEVSCISAFFYTALFATIRIPLTKFFSSNPTWIKRARSIEDRITVEKSVILENFETQCLTMQKALQNEDVCPLSHADSFFETASSDNLPLEGDIIDIVLSSPPYCTRIDYGIATLPEIAVMGLSGSEMRSLRKNLIGSTTVPKKAPEIEGSWGVTCNNFLANMADHESKASSTYYLKNHVQYFDSLAKSIGEIQRVLKKKGKCFLVVQDSYYKNLHNDLISITIEMSESRNMKLFQRSDFLKTTTMASVNPKSKPYRSSTNPTEAVLCFEKL